MKKSIRQLGCPLFGASILLTAMFVRLGPELADDGAFFLRYAANMAGGQFWVWNPNDNPVWGASAPLYPLLIAVPIALGLPQVQSMIWVGIITSVAALVLTGVTLQRKFGVATSTFFFILSALDTGVTYFAGSGLETPLTLLLMSLGLRAVLLHNTNRYAVCSVPDISTGKSC